jgi:hypothetical protein
MVCVLIFHPLKFGNVIHDVTVASQSDTQHSHAHLAPPKSCGNEENASLEGFRC